MPRALGGAPTLPGHRSGLPWGRPALGARWAARFVVIQCVYGAAVACAGWGRRKPQRPHPTPCYKLKTKLFRGSSACRYYSPKTASDAALLRLSRESREKLLAKGQIFPPPKICPFAHQRPKKHKIFEE